MKTYTQLVRDQDGIDEIQTPLPLSVIPNYMGINLCAVESLEWVKQDDGQLVSLTIKFVPEPQEV